MTHTSVSTRALPVVLVFALVATVSTCAGGLLDPAGDHIPLGTWGGTNTGMIVSDEGAHVHIGCTFGDVIGTVPLDSAGRFDSEGSYLVRAYPVAVGPSMPAQFTGTVRNGQITLVVVVNDTVAHQLAVLGPVTLQYGKTPQMGPCPICRTPAKRLR
jgi:hypothetical protein